MLSMLDPWAAVLARGYVSAGRELDDLEQVAWLGALKAVDRYDPSRGDLLAYALPTMRGEIRHYLRSTWSVHLPRELQELCVQLPRAEHAMTQQLGRAPTEAELAAFVGVAPATIRRARVARHDVRAVSWETPVPGANGDAPWSLDERVGGPDLRYDRVLDAAVVSHAMRRLRGEERTAIAYAYFEGRSQREIGERLGCSQMQVSRLLSRALERLQEHVGDGTQLVA